MAHGRFRNLPPFLWIWFVGGKVNKKTWLNLNYGKAVRKAVYERRMHTHRKEKVSRSILKDNTSRQVFQNESIAHEEGILISIRSPYRNL